MENYSERPDERVITLLEHYAIDTSAWHGGSIKTVNDLIEEVRLGESSLIENNNELLRLVRVVCPTIYARIDDRIYVLIENRQEFINGNVRHRNLGSSLGEKIINNESPLDALLRGLREELQIERFDEILYSGESVDRGDSQSYPGLLSEYRKYNYAVVLSPDDFCPEGYMEVQARKTTYFTWEKTQSLR